MSSKGREDWRPDRRYNLWEKVVYDPNRPFKRCNLGETNDLREVAALASWFDIKYGEAVKVLNALGVPLLTFGDRDYFNVNALEEAIFILSELGAPGFQLRDSRRPGRKLLRWPRSTRLRPTIEPLESLTPEWASVLGGHNLRERMEAVLATRRSVISAELEALTKIATERGDSFLRRLIYSRTRRPFIPKNIAPPRPKKETPHGKV